MKILGWVICLTLLMTVLMQAVAFQKATVCRQRVWLKSLEMRTSETLSQSSDSDLFKSSKCELQIIRKSKTITWFKGKKLNTFEVSLKGKL